MSSREQSREGSEAGSDNEDETQITVNSLEDSVEMLGEKRASNREGALATIIKEMQSNYHHAFAERTRMTLVEAYKRGLKKGSSKEQILSAKAVGVLTLTLGADAEDVHKELSPAMTEILGNQVDESVKEAVIDALSLLVFVANADEKGTLATMEVFAKVFDSSKMPVEQAAAMRGWALLATTVSPKHVHSILLPRHLSGFAGFLQSDDVDVRVTAGECIALLFEIAREEEGEEFSMKDMSGYTGVDVDELVETLRDLSQDKTRQRARKDKMKQRVPFKEVVATVEDGQPPKEVLSFKFQKFEFESWVKILQLGAVREALATGLKQHFENNELLQEIFDVHVDKEAKKQTLSQTEKRMTMSPSSPFAKARTKNLNKMRSNREHQVGDIMGSD